MIRVKKIDFDIDSSIVQKQSRNHSGSKVRIKGGWGVCGGGVTLSAQKVVPRTKIGGKLTKLRKIALSDVLSLAYYAKLSAEGLGTNFRPPPTPSGLYWIWLIKGSYDTFDDQSHMRMIFGMWHMSQVCYPWQVSHSNTMWYYKFMTQKVLKYKNMPIRNWNMWHIVTLCDTLTPLWHPKSSH
jgi:hypothetical protein